MMMILIRSLVLGLHRFQEEIQRLKDQLAGQGGAVDGDGESGQVRQQMSRTATFQGNHAMPEEPISP